MALCPDKFAYFIEDISNGISVINSLKPKKFFITPSLYDCSNIDCCHIECYENSKGKKKLYCCYNDISYAGNYSTGYFGDDIINNADELKKFVKCLKTVKQNDSNCFNGKNDFYYFNKEHLSVYQTKAIQELSQLILSLQAEVASLKEEIITLKNS